MSDKNERFSEEYLNAFVDGQLAQEEKDALFEELNGNDGLSRRVCELNKLHEMVQFAYDNPPGSHHQPNRRSGFGMKLVQGVAALMLIAVGGAAGWYSHSHANKPLDAVAMAHVATKLQIPDKNVILHLDSDDPGKLLTALDDTETLLTAFKQTGRNYAVEVVVNEGGMDLLRADRSPFPEKVEELTHKFKNVSFLACATAMHKLQEAGIKVHLLPGTKITPSAVTQIVHRIDQGWVYLKV